MTNWKEDPPGWIVITFLIVVAASWMPSIRKDKAAPWVSSVLLISFFLMVGAVYMNVHILGYLAIPIGVPAVYWSVRELLMRESHDSGDEEIPPH